MLNFDGDFNVEANAEYSTEAHTAGDAHGFHKVSRCLCRFVRHVGAGTLVLRANAMRGRSATQTRRIHRESDHLHLYTTSYHEKHWLLRHNAVLQTILYATLYYWLPLTTSKTVQRKLFVVSGLVNIAGNNLATRMHSSRMRTVRTSSCLLGGACSRGGGVSAPGGVSQHALRQTSPRGQNDRQV